MTNALSEHYARALADAVFGANSDLAPEQAIEQLGSVLALVQESKDLKWALLSPSVPKVRKAAITDQMAGLLGLHRLIRNFFMVLVSHRRVNDLGAIEQAFREIANERMGFVRAKITSARELTAEQREQVERALGIKTGKYIRPEYKVDTALLGGVRAQVGSTEYDGTVKGRLESMRHRLAQHS